jgi:hypothetical protein
MRAAQLIVWFSVTSCVLIVIGAVFAFVGLGVLPVSRGALEHWESAIYGAIMMGWGVTLFLVGRIAFRRGDQELLRALLYGVVVWLLVEALFSAYLGVWFNVGVDLVVLLLFGLPLVARLRSR